MAKKKTKSRKIRLRWERMGGTSWELWLYWTRGWWGTLHVEVYDALDGKIWVGKTCLQRKDNTLLTVGSRPERAEFYCERTNPRDASRAALKFAKALGFKVDMKRHKEYEAAFGYDG